MDAEDGGAERTRIEMMEVIGSEQGILGHGSFRCVGCLEGVVDDRSYGRGIWLG